MAGLALGACTTTSKTTSLSVAEAPAPKLRGANDIDAAMLTRIAHAAEQNGGGGVETEGLYRQLAQKQPRAAEPRVRLGEVLLRKNDLDGAEKAFREAVVLDEKSMDGWIGLAQVLIARQNNQQAIEALDVAMQKGGPNLRALNAKGVILDKEGRHAEAQAVYRGALAASPSNKMLRNNLGLSLALAGQQAEAVAILKPLSEEPDATDEHKGSLAFAMQI